MAVVQATIKNQLLALYNNMKISEYTETQFADSLATIIQEAILSADVKIGILVSTTGTASAQTGATTALGELI